MVIVGIGLATIASFLASGVLYALPPVSRSLAATSTPRPGVSAGVQMASVLFRSLVVAALLAGILTAAGWDDPVSGTLLGLSLVAVPAVLLLGAVVHENTPLAAAGIHLLDWTIKLPLIGLIVGLFL